jgi:hypothetical protein
MERTIVVKYLVARSRASAVVTSVSGASGIDKSKFSKFAYITPNVILETINEKC